MKKGYNVVNASNVYCGDVIIPPSVAREVCCISAEEFTEDGKVRIFCFFGSNDFRYLEFLTNDPIAVVIWTPENEGAIIG